MRDGVQCSTSASWRRIADASSPASTIAFSLPSSTNNPFISGTKISKSEMSKQIEPIATMPWQFFTISLLNGLLSEWTILAIPRCESITPFGLPVVPDV